MSHVFISHSHKDFKAAKKIRKMLEKANRVGWMAPISISPAAQWADEIDHALRIAEAVVVVVTPNARDSDYVTYEWSFALGAGKRVVPLLVKKTKSLHERLKAIHSVDFTGRWEPWPRLVELILGHLPQPGGKLAVASGAAEPAILAKFRGKSGRFVRNGDEYEIWLWVENVPAGAGKEVRYEILYPGFEDNPWRERRGADGNYKTWISSYGDVLITVDGKSDGGAWYARTSLYDALRRYYGDNPPRKIAKAIEDIRKN